MSAEDTQKRPADGQLEDDVDDWYVDARTFPYYKY